MPPGVVEVHAEALPLGAAVTLPTGTAWSVGLDVSAGKHAVVDLTDEGHGIDTYATGYLVLRWTPAAWQVALGPIGFAAVVGATSGPYTRAHGWV